MMEIKGLGFFLTFTALLALFAGDAMAQNTRYFYFLPPNDPEWILNTPILWNGTTQTKMEIDPDRCGWYRIVYFNNPPSDEETLILQTPKDSDPNSTNRMGALGMGEDPADWVDGIPTPIRMKSRFDAEYGEGKGGDLFFVADGAKMGWTKTDPMIEETNRCTCLSLATGLSLATRDSEIKGDVCLKSDGGGSCADVGGDGGMSTKCGTEIQAGLKYYLRNRAGTAGDDLAGIGVPGVKGTLLDKDSEYCETRTDRDGDSHLLCYGGIKIYDRLGKVQVLVDDVTGLAGTWQVWVTHNEDPHPVMKIMEFTKNVRVQIVWGEVRTDDGRLIDNLHPSNSVSVVAGKTVKIGFAAAEPSGDNKFSVLMDDKGGSPGQIFSIAATSREASGVRNSELTLCYDEACNHVADGNSFAIPRLGQPSAGLLVLYAKGNFQAADDAEYVIKVQGSRPEFKLKVYQPRIRFVNLITANASPRILSSVQTRFSDPAKPGGDTDKWVWLGEEMKRTIAAFDPSTNPDDESRWTPCGALCNDLELSYTAWAEVEQIKDRGLVDINGLRMENGVAELSMAGMTPVEKVKGSNDYDWATVRVRGPSPLEATATEWSKLQFRKPPVLFPTSAELFDRKGGGRGDSLVIAYNSKFGVEGVHDYPNYIQVIWDETRTDTIGYGSQYKRENGQYVFSGSTKSNEDFWKQYMINDSTLVITRDDYDKSFSGDRIKTGGDGMIVSWATFENPDRPGALMTAGSGRSIDEKIPPIVISATYIGGEDCGATRENRCTDNVVVDLSEPVKLAEGSDENAVRTAFAYILRSMNKSEEFKVFDRQDDLPAIIRWKTSGRLTPAESGDSNVTLTYRAYKTKTDTAFTPIAGDSIRFLTGQSYSGIGTADPSSHPLIDLKGNHPHPREWGRQIVHSGNSIIISKAPPMLRFQEPVYYNLKGEPLGKQKPKRAGVYIVRQNGVNKMVVVK